MRTSLLSLLLVAAVTVALAPRTARADDAAAGTAAPQFIRIVEEPGRTVALEVATHELASDEHAARVLLVGVVHIGDRAFYRDLQKQLDACDLVLFESIRPDGAGAPRGPDDEARALSTRNALRFLAALIETHRLARGAYPDDGAALRSFVDQRDSRMGGWVDQSLQDAWSRPVVYLSKPDPAGFTLTSLGADGRSGGEGFAADIIVSDADGVPAVDLGADGIQRDLAEALSLEFQLDAMQYDRAHWVCSDMTMGELNRALRERGADFEFIGGTLAGTSLPAKLIKFILGFVRVADALFEGAVSDMLKVAIMEMLSDERMVELSLDQLAPGFAEVIVEQRNQVVTDDLAGALEAHPEAETIAVFYGAAHLPDMLERFESQLGYRSRDVRWAPAITVDLASSSVPPAELHRMRQMMRQTLRQQARALEEMRRGRIDPPAQP